VAQAKRPASGLDPSTAKANPKREKWYQTDTERHLTRNLSSLPARLKLRATKRQASTPSSLIMNAIILTIASIRYCLTGNLLLGFTCTSAGSTKRRLAPSDNSERESKSRRTGDGNQTSAPGQGQGPNAPRTAGGGSGGTGQQPPGYSAQQGSISIGTHTIALDDAYGQRHGQKREEYADQRLMDELKKGMYINSLDYMANLIFLRGLPLEELADPLIPMGQSTPGPSRSGP
jgi:hypothetical protein